MMTLHSYVYISDHVEPGVQVSSHSVHSSRECHSTDEEDEEQQERERSGEIHHLQTQTRI